MRLFEHESKQLLARMGIPIPRGVLLSDPGDAGEMKDLEYPVTVKSQVLTGGRMKAGGVVFAQNATELRDAVGDLLNLEIGGHTAETVLIERINSYSTGIP